ncbi:MAG: hypothetical protein Q4G63_10465 [Bacteroidia bacterium]|nr:hypothetical protein [Bacteroidia bacterium]
MKRKLLVGLSLFFTLLIGYACTSSPSQDYLDEFEVRRLIDEAIKKNNGQLEFTQWKIVNILVNSADWAWNEQDESYGAVVDLPELTEFIFDKGGAIGYFKWGDNRKTPLPFSNTDLFDVTDVNGVVFQKAIEETISCDFELGNPSVVVFTRQLGDRSKMNNPSDASFQIVLFW